MTRRWLRNAEFVVPARMNATGRYCRYWYTSFCAHPFLTVRARRVPVKARVNLGIGTGISPPGTLCRWSGRGKKMADFFFFPYRDPRFEKVPCVRGNEKKRIPIRVRRDGTSSEVYRNVSGAKKPTRCVQVPNRYKVLTTFTVRRFRAM